jgi:hypothetical protein
MLSMNGIIVCELLLGVVLMSLVFTLLANTDLVADSSSKSKQETQADGFRSATRPGHTLAEISCQMYMSVLAGDYYWAKATGAAPVPSGK